MQLLHDIGSCMQAIDLMRWMHEKLRSPDEANLYAAFAVVWRLNGNGAKARECEALCRATSAGRNGPHTD